MAELYAEQRCSVIGVVDVPREQTSSYGIVQTSDPRAQVSPISAIVEKPEPALAPSTLGVVGRYVLTPKIFELLATQRRAGAGRSSLPTQFRGCSRRSVFSPGG
jgi:UTP--glucose-1-phosphate uridylyltransferase